MGTETVQKKPKEEEKDPLEPVGTVGEGMFMHGMSKSAWHKVLRKALTEKNHT